MGEDCEPCLLKISFSPDGKNFHPVTFSGQPKLFIRALGIFLLLVKYVGKNGADAKGQLPFTVPGMRKTWINTIADGLAQNHTLAGFFGETLAGTGFITKAKDTFKHPTVQNKKPAWVKFDTHQLLPERIYIYEATSAAPDGELVVSSERILELARILEGHSSAVSWAQVVDEVVESFKVLHRDSSEPGTTEPPPSTHAALVRADEVWRRIFERMSTPTLLEEWFIVSDSLHEFLNHWELFDKGVRKHKVQLKWMFFCPEAMSECLSMRLQWNRHEDTPPLGFKRGNPSVKQKEQIGRLKQLCLKTIPTKQQREIHLEFYQSRVTLPFTAFMAIPYLTPPHLEAIGKSLKLAYSVDYRYRSPVLAFDPIGRPPLGTFCGVIHHGVYESTPSLAGYVGEEPDASGNLGMYHYAIKDMFLRCLGEGHCTQFRF